MVTAKSITSAPINPNDIDLNNILWFETKPIEQWINDNKVKLQPLLSRLRNPIEPKNEEMLLISREIIALQESTDTTKPCPNDKTESKSIITDDVRRGTNSTSVTNSALPPELPSTDVFKVPEQTKPPQDVLMKHNELQEVTGMNDIDEHRRRFLEYPPYRADLALGLPARQIIEKMKRAHAHLFDVLSSPALTSSDEED